MSCSSTNAVIDQQTSAIVFGGVRGADQEPVSGASVRVEVFPFLTGECRSTAPMAGARRTTDGEGHYRVVLRTFGPTMDGCVAVHVELPAGAGLAGRTVSGVEVEFRVGQPKDSVRVDVEFLSEG